MCMNSEALTNSLIATLQYDMNVVATEVGA
jgi:hypothetical protein